MRVAVIGAGIVGVTTAHELAVDGHEVTVYERHGAVASETSFANAGVIAPGYVTPWAAPGMPWKVLRQMLGRHAAVRVSGTALLTQLPWLWRWWRNCRPAAYRSNRGRLFALARYSQLRLHELTAALDLEYEQTRGLLVLLRSAQDLARARASLQMLEELQVAHELLDAAQCRRVEPALNPEMPLHAAISLPRDEVGNCRRFAQALKPHAQRRGVRFRLRHDVVSLRPGPLPQLAVRDLDSAEPHDAEFDVVVVCAGHRANALLQPLGLKLPLAAVHGYSVTAPLHLEDGRAGPRGAVMDERYKVAVSRLGQRIRVAGSAELGGRADAMNAAALATLYKVLEDWFPGMARLSQAIAWKGARPMLPDGPPLLGRSRCDGIWLNVGHGSSGWALACGSARVVADLLAARDPGLDAAGFAPQRSQR